MYVCTDTDTDTHIYEDKKKNVLALYPNEFSPTENNRNYQQT